MTRQNSISKVVNNEDIHKEDTFETFRARAAKILKAQNIEDAVSLEVTESISHIKKYEGKGRPGPNRPYKMIETRTLNLDFKRNEHAIDQSLILAGWRIYVTNTLKIGSLLTKALAIIATNGWWKGVFIVSKREMCLHYHYFCVYQKKSRV
ncbi:MAG: hypothetical protein ABH826_03330 [Patescibacteria group bacterium]